MNAHEIIESYVTDVAVQVPAKQRADVAAELCSLLHEELGSGDEAAALALVRRFGRPSEVAARYHMPFTLIDPADTRSFVLAAVVGTLLIPSSNRHLPFSIEPNMASLLFLAWLGALLLFFAARSWAMRRWPDSFQWKPSPLRTDAVAPIAQLGLIALFAALGALYWMPGPILDALSGGRIDARAFAYTQDFQSPLRLPWFPILLAVLIVLHLMAAVARHWTRPTRFLEFAFLACAGVQLGWHAAYGHVFLNAAVDLDGRLAMQLVGAAMVIAAAFEARREWTRLPPAQQPPVAAAA